MADAPRHEARERAVALLYEAAIKAVAVSEVLAALAVAPDAFTVSLVESVAADAAHIDALVSGTAVGWEIDRMPVVDRTILRLAVAELLTEPDVPVAVVIDEAVELAKVYSTEESGAFVNGVLSTIAHQVRPPH